MLLLNKVEKSIVLKKQKRRGERNILILHRDGLAHTYVEIAVIIGQNLKNNITFSTKHHINLICRRNFSSVCWCKFAGPILPKTCDGEFHIFGT